jgi:pyruvate-formate lyase-activating enzyme
LGWEHMCIINCSLFHLSSVRYYVFVIVCNLRCRVPPSSTGRTGGD